MAIEQITTTAGAAPSGSYSQGLRVGDFIFVSGQGPLDPENGSVIGRTIEEQTVVTMDNIQAIIQAAGVTMDDVVKVTVHLSSMDLFEGFDEVYATYFSHPMPTRTTVGSELLGIMIEVDAIAYVGS